MKKRLVALMSYSLFWLVFFFAARLIFILTHYSETSLYPAGEIISTFWYGLQLDLSATGYILLIPVLVMIPGVFSAGDWYGKFLKWYTIPVICISSIIVIADTLLYKYWGFRMDYTPLTYLSTPKEAAASVTPLQMTGVFAGIAALSSLFIILYNKFINRLFRGYMKVRPGIPAMLAFMVLWGSLIIPIRGGLGLAPIYAGTVYFSGNSFVNHVAINVVWNVGSSVINGKPVKNPYVFDDPSLSERLVDSLTVKSGEPDIIVRNQRPNILFLVLESFGSAFTGPLAGDTLTTPEFNRYCREGVLFTNFYASGFRTDKAMPAILNGFPAQPAASIMKDSKKTQALPSIIKTFKALGYTSAFWYGGDINFANFNAYLINSGFTQIITEDNFDPQFRNSKWGIHDHVLFEALADSMADEKEPFIKVILSLSSHEPFEIPVDPEFEGKDELTKFRNSVYYIDSVLGKFLDWAKGTDWWDNTLVIVVADHFRRNSGDVAVYSEDIFQIPMLWLGGALSVRGKEINKFGSQVDIPITLLHQLQLDDNYPYSKDLLTEGAGSFAFYTFNEGFGFITDSSKYIYDHKLGAPVINEGPSGELAGRLGKAYLQVLYDDFLKK